MSAKAMFPLTWPMPNVKFAEISVVSVIVRGKGVLTQTSDEPVSS